MKILLTGAAGYAGSALLPKLEFYIKDNPKNLLLFAKEKGESDRKNAK